MVFESMPGLVVRTYPHANGTTPRSDTFKKKFQKELSVYMMVLKVLKDRLDDADAEYVHRGIKVDDEYAFIEERAVGDGFDFVNARRHDTRLTKVRLQMALEMVRGFRFLHNRCVFMKDFKLENCLLFRKKNGQYLLRVADFNIVQHGVSELYSGVDAIMLLKGTFLAPEEQKQQTSIGLSADVFRVGYVLYVLFFAGAHETKTGDQQKYPNHQWDVLFPYLKFGYVFDRVAVRTRLIELWRDDDLMVVNNTASQTLTYFGHILSRLILPMLHPDPETRMGGFESMEDYWTSIEQLILWLMEVHP